MWLENDEENKTNVNGQPSTGSNLSVGSGGDAAQPGQTPSGVVGNPSTITPTPSGQTPQKFATVQDYLGANRQQGEDLGQKFTSNLEDTANQEKSAISGAAQQASNDISAATPTYDAGLTSKALSNPTEVTKSPDQLSSFLKQWNASYSGPSSFEASTSYAPAATAANEAGQKAAELKTAGGQQQLLQDQFNVYGQGNKGIDQALLQNSSAFPEVQNKVNEFGNIQDYLTSQAGTVNTQAQEAQAAADAAKANTKGAFTNNLTNFQNKINANVAANRAYATANPSTSHGIPLNPNSDITAANVSTPEDYANAEAYGKLTGVNYGGILNPANVTQSNTQNQIFKLQQELKSITDSFNGNPNDLKAVTDQYNNAITSLKQAGGYSEGGVVKNNLYDYLKGKR